MGNSNIYQMDNGGIFVLLLILNVQKKLFYYNNSMMLPYFATPYDHNKPSVAFLFLQSSFKIFYFNEPKTDNKDDGYS
jgi:hypothetical protein